MVKKVAWKKDGEDVSDDDEHKKGSLVFKTGTYGHFEAQLKLTYTTGASMVKEFKKGCTKNGRLQTCTSEYSCVAFINDKAKVQSSTTAKLKVVTGKWRKCMQ